MKESEHIEKIILDALAKAEQQGQPVADLLQAITRGEDIDTWIEPAEHGKVTLAISVKV